MTNHIHLVLAPATDTGLQQLLKPLHMRYAQRLNRNIGRTGHVWQGRYYSSPLDEQYTWAAIRYVELNPVRAKLVRKAERYLWSSAAGHCGLQPDPLVTAQTYWRKQFNAIDDWSAWLAQGNDTDELVNLRRNINKGLPCGTDSFIRKLERRAGRSLTFRPPGRPRREPVEQ